jgi:GNAT superfamily N-acetyltransferase
MEGIKLNITTISPFSPDAGALMEELSDRLQSITGDSGKNSFEPQDVCGERAVFVIARNEEGKAIGCGAFRPMNQTTAEVKRMYAKEKGRGVGRQILTYLEHKAYEMGYETLCLETRLVNTSAVSFYERSGYKRIPNYGKYAGREDAICFEKLLLM